MLAVALLVRTGGKWSAKTSFPFLCAAVANFLAVLLYTLAQPLIAKIYTPDSAMGVTNHWTEVDWTGLDWTGLTKTSEIS